MELQVCGGATSAAGIRIWYLLRRSNLHQGPHSYQGVSGELTNANFSREGFFELPDPADECVAIRLGPRLQLTDLTGARAAFRLHGPFEFPDAGRECVALRLQGSFEVRDEIGRASWRGGGEILVV